MPDDIILDIYYGHNAAYEKRLMTGEPVRQAQAELEKVEKALRQRLGEDADGLLERYGNAQGELNALTAQIFYTDGFRTGARLMLEVLEHPQDN